MTTELWCKRSRQQVGTTEIGFEHPVPNLRRQSIQVVERDPNVPSRIVDENINPVECGKDLLEGRTDRTRITLIEMHRHAAPADRLHSIHNRRCTFCAADVRDDDVNSRRCQCGSDCAADVSRSPGNECDLAREIHCASPCVWLNLV